MDYTLLTNVGIVIDYIIKGGYVLSAGILARTGIIYIKDYKHSVEQEKLSEVD